MRNGRPQSHAEDIRRFFVENGFEILFEDACIDSGKLYCAMTAEYTGEIKEKTLAYIYSGELPKCRKKEAKMFLDNINSRLKKKLEAEKIHGTAENAEYLEKVTNELEETINGMQTDS